MTAFQKILVPTDGSSCSKEAIRTASELASGLGASLTLVYFFEPFKYALPEGYVVYTPEQLAEMVDHFEQMLKEAKLTAEGHGASSVHTHVLQGVAAEDVGAYAEEHGFDLIVMGTHGRGALGRMFLGSVADKVVRASNVPVMTVRAPE